MSILLNPANNYYLINEKVWKLGGGDIYNDQGEKIGKMHRVIVSLRADIELQEPDGRNISKVRKKIISIRPRYDILDMNDNLLGYTEQKLLAIFRPKLLMKSPDGRVLYTAQGNFMRWDFDIKHEKRKVAEIRKADRWRDVFFRGIFNLKDTYAVHIIDPSVDRLALLSFVIAIDNSFHDPQTRRR